MSSVVFTRRTVPVDRRGLAHREIAVRYSDGRRNRGDEKPDHNRLITLVRLRELERLFRSRYGRLLPDDDSGMDDLLVAAHHVSFLRGDVIDHIVGWARASAPWLPEDKARQLAERVAAEPRKFTADALAWRLRLSMAERTALKITTIGAFDVSKAERAEERKRKDREAKRAKRAATRSGRPRGRPKKNASTAVRDSIADDAFSDHSPAACEARAARGLRPELRPNGLRSLGLSKVRSLIPAKGRHREKSKTVGGERAPARSGNQAEDSLGSIPNIPPNCESLAWHPNKPDGLIRNPDFSDEEPIGNRESTDRKRKTRIRSTFRPTRRQRAIAAELGILPDRIGNLFGAFTCHHLAKGSYSADWEAEWGKYVATSEEINARWRATSQATAEADRSYIDPRL